MLWAWILAHTFSKLTTYGVLSAVLSWIMCLFAVTVKDSPETQLMHLGSPAFELWIPIMMTTWVSAILGLLLSAFVRSNDQVMPVLIVVLMVQLVLHGGLIPATSNDTLNFLSKFVPARWGYAAAASSVHLNDILGSHTPNTNPDPDLMWSATKVKWRLDMSMLTLFGIALSVVTWIKLRTFRH